MTIDKLSGINPLHQLNKNSAVSNRTKSTVSDSVNFSPDAKVMSELYQIAEQVKGSPDVRQDKIASIIEQIKNDPDFFGAAKIEAVAEKLAKLLY